MAFLSFPENPQNHPSFPSSNLMAFPHSRTSTLRVHSCQVTPKIQDRLNEHLSVLAIVSKQALRFKQQGTDAFCRLDRGNHAQLHWHDTSREIYLISLRMDDHG
ncbi:hypothetical protein R1flu_003679 [Riccia fluitans]|uniref:Uncharacterized protein n=1 Tax=Riccia fluitans TaxID=41844 RepID=A0ABD1Y9N7_9MARC